MSIPDVNIKKPGEGLKKVQKVNPGSVDQGNVEKRVRIVEVIGPPGIGKSTIYKALCGKWQPNAPWIYQEALLAPGKPSFFAFSKWLEYHFRKFSGKPKKMSLSVDYGLQFVDNNVELAHFYWNHLSDPHTYKHEEIGHRFRSSYFLFSDFCRYQALLATGTDKTCVIDEGFLQKSFLLQENKQKMIDIVNRYVPLLPLPDAVIYINTTHKDVILNRLERRNKVIASHQGKDKEGLLADIEKWQFLFEIIVDKMKVNRIPVHNIDAERPVAENAFLLNKILSDR